MPGNVDETLEDFLWGKTDVNDYLKRVAECNSSIAESLNRKVAGLHETLDKQLREGVETNLPRLLEQVPALQSLEDTLHSVQMRMSSVASESNRLSTICDELVTKLREQNRQFESTLQRRNVASDAQRCEELFEALEKRSDLVKKAEITAEIKEIMEDNRNLKKIDWLKNMVDTKLKIAENDIRRNGAEELKRGLASLNNSLVTSSQRALRTLNFLDAELEVLMSSSIVELDKKLMELSSGTAESSNKLLPMVVALIQTHLEQAYMLGENYRKKFSEKLARLIRSRVPLDTSYALRFVQQLGRVFNSKGDCQPALNDSLRPLKNSLLAHSLARLHRLVDDHDFATSQANAFVDLINSAMEEELKKVEWDQELRQKMGGNIEKCIEMIAKKMETNLHLQRDDLLLGDRLTANQMTNYRLIQTADGIVKRWANESKSVNNVQKETLDAILNEVKNSIRAIVSRMHVEKRRESRSVSPYMQELLTYMNHIDMHMAHVSRAVCHSHVLSQIAEFVIDSFVLNASLVRTAATDERKMMVVDFSRLLETVRAMEWPSKYGDTSKLLELFGNVDSMLGVEGIRKSIFVQLLVSDSPDDLQLPHQSVEWTIEEYVKWYEEHDEQEVLALLNGLITSYNSLVISKGQQQYVEHYPIILKLLAESF